MLDIVHRLIKGEAKERANIRSDASENPKGNLPLKGLAGSVIKNEAHVRHTQEPGISRSTSTIHQRVGDTFNSLVTAFSGVLVLVVWFALPIIDA